MEGEIVRYLLIIFDDPAEIGKLNEVERARILRDYRTFTDDLATAGNFRAGEALEPATTATTVRVRGGRRIVSDAPFADTPEQLVGYYLVEARDLDEAIRLAERVPSARFGAVEVRPVRFAS
jgi:hypothetical protein